MSSEYIVNVSEATFDQEVLHYSLTKPVVVDFWATWCIPCKVLSPILEKLVDQGQGSYRLAKLDVDENPRLAQHYNVRSVPAVKAFREGQVVAEFNGALPEPKVIEFIKSIAPSPSDLALEKGKSLMALNQWAEAETTFREMLESEPDHPQALLGLARSILIQGHGREAAQILRNFPAVKEYNAAQQLIPLADALNEFERGDLPDDSALDATYRNAVRLVTQGNIYAAMDGLLEIIRQDKRFRGGKVRQIMLALLDILGDANEETRQYRAELASALF